MINHTVLFKIKSEATEEQVQAMIDGLNALQDKIEEIEEIIVRKNFSERSQGHSVMLYSTFKSKEALESYQVHEAHKAVVVDYVKPIMESLLVGDIEL